MKFVLWNLRPWTSISFCRSFHWKWKLRKHDMRNNERLLQTTPFSLSIAQNHISNDWPYMFFKFSTQSNLPRKWRDQWKNITWKITKLEAYQSLQFPSITISGTYPWPEIVPGAFGSKPARQHRWATAQSNKAPCSEALVKSFVQADLSDFDKPSSKTQLFFVCRKRHIHLTHCFCPRQ